MTKPTARKPGPTMVGPAKQSGFTLIELMIVLVVIAVLAAIAVPSYIESIQRSRRSDAQIALVEMAALLDKFRNDNLTYTTALGDLPYPAVSPEGYYTLSIDGATNATFYQVEAAPTGDQADDTQCSLFVYTSTNVRSTEDGDGNDTTDTCWP